MIKFKLRVVSLGLYKTLNFSIGTHMGIFKSIAQKQIGWICSNVGFAHWIFRKTIFNERIIGHELLKTKRKQCRGVKIQMINYKKNLTEDKIK